MDDIESSLQAQLRADLHAQILALAQVLAGLSEASLAWGGTALSSRFYVR